MADDLYLRIEHQRDDATRIWYTVLALVRPDGTVLAGWRPIPVRHGQTLTVRGGTAGEWRPQVVVRSTIEPPVDDAVIDPAYLIV